MSKPVDTSCDFKRARFLIVDESADTRRLLKMMLAESGAEQIDETAYAAEAIGMMAQVGYDVVLCDFHLGAGRDGQQLLEEARFKGILKASTLFVMVTAENTAQVVMGVLECRPDDYLSLPFTREQFSARMQRQRWRSSPRRRRYTPRCSRAARPCGRDSAAAACVFW
ncbi:MAG: response regulator [Gammaproteobacteria bacterium]|nr:response regulator [Gammaproteobacteria bacterium]